MTKTPFLFFLLSLLLIGFGYVGYKKNFTVKNPIYYISKQEILDLENVRIKGNNNPQIFNSKISEAFEIIEEEVKIREKAGQIIIFSDKEVSGRNVESISKEIHNKVIDRLEQK